MKKIIIIIVGILLAAFIAAYLGLKETGLQGSAFTAKNICSGVFVSQLPAATVFEQAVVPASPPLGLASYTVDDSKQIVTTRLLGLYQRAAQYRAGLGCTLIPVGEEALSVSRVRLRAGSASGDESTNLEIGDTLLAAKLERALDTAFSENDSRGLKNTKAVVVLHAGKLVAERYAANIDFESPLVGWSMTKSITNMLVGILVRQGKLNVNDPAPVSEWANDERKSITLNDLLHMSSGLEFNETYGMNTDVTQMLTMQANAGAFAASKSLIHPPGEFWDYSSGTTNIIARIIHQTVGGDLAASQQFARTELFHPLGIHNVFLEPDPSGIFVGSSFLYLSARDWAQLGQLMLQDGVWRDQRILPEGWVEYSVTPATANKDNEYGAHFWLNLDPTDANKQRRWPDVPTDAYSMNGFQGQYVVIIPSHQLVVVRLGFTPNPVRPGMNQLLSDIIAAL